ncbi:N-acetylmuramoyl-L-alanine amidase [Aestuariibaculum sp. M13]|uniref:N-acetylmuramoyl-L-alanine amidase family protein n=1 Tax=Aestuariibaculum sp. M13 TaxID=2967132 RepID=UPI002159D28D|nr:N-acetylmuramoyl-L-alanine amidase [Aestuariibaculum sp. M13]MCR8667484.1 N-acetylmuramoyl-L-alanine amidase [Aestuariibaculum sp. M13]
MKKILKSCFKNVSFLLILMFWGLCFTQNANSKSVVVIDPGHGGLDAGAVGFGIQEKNITLAIAQEMLRLNQILFENQLEIYLTRYADTLVSLTDRNRLAKTLHADAFVSIHCNASKHFARGIEVFVPKGIGIYSYNSLALANCMLKNYHHKLGFESRGIKTANFAVLRTSIPHYPAVLIEMGFISQSDEAGYFSNPKHITAMALALLEGLYHQLNSKL